MREKIYKGKIQDIKLNAVIYEKFFQIKKADGFSSILSQIKNIHQHSLYEIFIVLDGSLHVANEKEGRDYENSVLIIPPRYNHYTISSVKHGYGFYVSIQQSNKEDADISVEKLLSKKITSFSLDDTTSFYAKHFAESIQNGKSEENITHLLSLLFSSLFDQLSTPAPSPKRTSAQSKYRNYIHDIEQYLAKNIGRKFTLQELAEALYLCPKQVSRIIKRKYSCSFTDLVNEKRLTLACMLLEQTNLNIKQVSATVGYEYENYFFKLFKAKYGINPTQYRKEHAVSKSAD